jgi:Fic family protein
MQNQIGNPAHYVPPPPNYLAENLDKLEKYIHAKHRYDPLVEAFLVHYQFEAIHPFRDGNGRVGRLLLSILIEDWCNLSDQWLYMSAYFDKHREEYIDRLLKVSTNNEWRGWIEFCLLGVVEQANDTERRYERLLQLDNKYKERVEQIKGSYRLRSITDSLFELPVVRVTSIRDKYKVSYPTARRDIDKLVEAGILSEIPDMPTVAFFAPEVIKITYEE